MRRRGLIAVVALVINAAGNLLMGGEAAKLDAAFGKLPLSFEANRGQFDPRVRFAARGPGYSLFLTRTEAVLDLRRAKSPVRMRLAGANKNPAIAGVDPLPGRSNYYMTHQTDRRSAVRGLLEGARRYENVPSYAGVRYAAVYRGVDLIYHGNQRQLEYDLIVAPGADPNVIRLAFDGVDRMSVSPEGELVLQVAGGEIRQHKPIVYQMIDGIKRGVDGGYVLTPSRQVAFEVGAYDRSKPLILDPTITYGTYLGGSDSDLAQAIAIDSSGNAYITGQSHSTDFPLVPPDPTPIASGHYVLFVAKFNSTGTALLYSTYFDDDPTGGSFNIGYGIKVDAAGNAYVTGEYGPMSNAVILRLTASGVLAYGLSIGDGGDNEGRGIAIDGAGNAYVTGLADSNFFTTTGAYQTMWAGAGDAFIAKLNTNFPSDATSVVYSTYLGGPTDDRGNAIAIDASGNAYITGETLGGVPVTAGAFQSTSGGGLSDVFVSKLSADGKTLLYSTLFGGDSFESGYAIAVDPFGYAYIAGYVESNGLPTTSGAYQTAWLPGDCKVNFGDPTTPCGDAFVAKFNPSASGIASLVYSTYLGSTGRDLASALAIDGGGNAYVAGYVHGAPFTPTGPFPSVNPIPGYDSTNSDGFIARLSASGSALTFSSYYTDQPAGLVIDGSGNVYVAGGTDHTTGIATGSAYQMTNHGAEDAFVAKISGFPVLPTITSQPQSQSIASGQTASMSVAATGPVPISYQWYIGSSGTISNPIAGATSATYTTPALTNTTRYWVRVTNPSGSSDSNTAKISVLFSDDPLTVGVSVIRAVHITELRSHIAALRVRFGLPAFTYMTDPSLTAGVTVRAQHILELRTALAQVYMAAGFTVPPYTDPGLGIGTVVRRAHVSELRAAVIAIE